MTQSFATKQYLSINCNYFCHEHFIQSTPGTNTCASCLLSKTNNGALQVLTGANLIKTSYIYFVKPMSYTSYSYRNQAIFSYIECNMIWRWNWLAIYSLSFTWHIHSQAHHCNLHLLVASAPTPFPPVKCISRVVVMLPVFQYTPLVIIFVHSKLNYLHKRYYIICKS